MFCYTVSLKADREKFQRVCNLIETCFQNCNIERVLLVSNELLDVDYYLAQEYIVNGQKIKVVCENLEIDAVYIDSEIDLKIVLNEEIIVEYEK